MNFDPFILKNHHVIQYVLQENLAVLVAAENGSYMVADVILKGRYLIYNPPSGLYHIHAVVQFGQLLVIPLVHHSHLLLGNALGEKCFQDILLLLHQLADLKFKPIHIVGCVRLPCLDSLHGNINDSLNDPTTVDLQGR